MAKGFTRGQRKILRKQRDRIKRRSGPKKDHIILITRTHQPANAVTEQVKADRGLTVYGCRYEGEAFVRVGSHWDGTPWFPPTKVDHGQLAEHLLAQREVQHGAISLQEIKAAVARLAAKI